MAHDTPGRLVSLDMDQLTPSQRGAVAEAAFATAALELGLTALRPICEGRRYDLVLDLEPRLLRVQCKLARHRGGALVIQLQTNRCTPAGYVSTSYTAEEVDAIGAYAPDLRRCFLIPIAEVCGRRAVHLRLEPTKNNQAEGIKWARDYALATTLAHWRAGAVATPRAVAS
jgi:hypothetical protein